MNGGAACLLSQINPKYNFINNNVIDTAACLSLPSIIKWHLTPRVWSSAGRSDSCTPSVGERKKPSLSMTSYLLPSNDVRLERRERLRRSNWEDGNHFKDNGSCLRPCSASWTSSGRRGDPRHTCKPGRLSFFNNIRGLALNHFEWAE